MTDSNITVVEGLVAIPEVKRKLKLPWDSLTEPGKAFVIHGVTKKRNVIPPAKLGMVVTTKLVSEGLQVIRVS